MLILREKLLSNIAQLVAKFVHDVSIKQGLSEKVASEAGGRIYTSGSYRCVSVTTFWMCGARLREREVLLRGEVTPIMSRSSSKIWRRATTSSAGRGLVSTSCASVHFCPCTRDCFHLQNSPAWSSAASRLTADWVCTALDPISTQSASARAIYTANTSLASSSRCCGTGLLSRRFQCVRTLRPSGNNDERD